VYGLLGVGLMRRKRLFVAVLFLSVLIFVPPTVSPAVVNLHDYLFSFRSGATTEESLLPGLSVSPYHILDESLQVDSPFNVTVNVSNVTDLFSWQVTLFWNSSLLTVNRIFAGEFLNRTDSLNKTSSAPSYYGGMGYVIQSPEIVVGNVSLVESILEDAVPGSVLGVTGSGVLVTVEFLVTGYGCTGLDVSLSGDLRTMLLNSTLVNGVPGEIPLAPENVHSGYFRNKLSGDANGDRFVDVFDVLKVKYHRSGPPPGPGGYERNVDINDDGVIDVFDILIVKANLGRSI